MRINLHIKCYVDDDKTERLRDLGLEVEDGQTEYRPFSIEANNIIGFYPNPDGGCFVMIGDMELTVQEGFKQLNQILCDAGK